MRRLPSGGLTWKLEAPGSAGDATILSLDHGRFDYADVMGEHLEGDQRLTSKGVVVAGRWWHP
jgi:dihydroorotase